MKLVIISSAPLLFREGKAYAYSPYVKEIVIWEKYTEEIVLSLIHI